VIGNVIGDCIGSVYEWKDVEVYDFEILGDGTDYTDDSVMTFATCSAILNNKDYGECYKDFGQRYPGRGYGGMFQTWLDSPSSNAPFNSFGNGSAMRVSPIGYAFDDPKKVLEEAKKSAECTHNHPEGIKGAQATALAVYMARVGKPKEEIKRVIAKGFGYDLNRTLAEIAPVYKFDATCQGSVPEAIICFLESDSFIDAIKKAIRLNGDSDTLACITGGIAQAFYKEIPRDIAQKVAEMLPEEFQNIIRDFYKTFKIKVKTI
jgi:ADP-ribosylglycohydrolase